MDRIPLKIKFDDDSRETAEVYVEAVLEGQPRRFLLDTGCAKTTLVNDEMTTKLTSGGKHQSSGALGRADYDLVQIGSLTLGPIQKKDLIVSRAQVGRTDRNLLGMDFLREARFYFSFDRDEVEIISSGDEKLKFAKETLLLERGLIPYVKCDIGGGVVQAVWDTGAGVTVVDINFIKSNPQIFEACGYETGTDSTNTQQETSMYNMKDLVIGNRCFQPHKVAAVDFSHINARIEIPMIMVLGYSTLRQANWVFDFLECKWGIVEMLG